MAAAAAGLLAVAACQPTVRVEAPREPITINLNVKLDADVRVRLEETARKDISSNPSIF
ncbi:MAG: YnbE family lipoprotein [Sneathiellaceae bacterium]